MENYIIIGAVVLILALACFYVIKEKRKGRKCIGCPMSGQCSRCQSKK